MKLETIEEKELYKKFRAVIPKETVDEELEKIFIKYRNQMEIPGFRKGKAPLSLVKRHKKQEAEEELKTSLMTTHFSEAYEQTGLTPAVMPSIDESELKEDGSFEFTFGIHYIGEIEPAQYKGVTVDIPEFEVSEEEMNRQLRILQERQAQAIPKEEDPVEEGDLVVFSLSGKIGDIKVEPSQPQILQTVVGTDRIFSGTKFEDNFIGMKIGDIKDIELTLPDDYYDNKLAGKNCKVHIKVKEIKQIKFPALNDEFARSFKDIENMESLRNWIKEQLRKEHDKNTKERIPNMVVDKVVSDSVVKFPESMVDEQFKRDFPNVDSSNQYYEIYRKITKNKIKSYLVLNKIAQEENIEVSEAEAEDALAREAAEKKTTAAALKEELVSEDGWDDYLNDLKMEKVKRFIFENSTHYQPPQMVEDVPGAQEDSRDDNKQEE